MEAHYNNVKIKKKYPFEGKNEYSQGKYEDNEDHTGFADSLRIGRTARGAARHARPTIPVCL